MPADTGVHGSFLEHVSYFGLFGTQRWTIFLTLGVLAWLIISWYQPRALDASPTSGADHGAARRS